MNLSLRVDNADANAKEPWNSEAKVIEPGQTKTLRVYFGYSYGFRPSYKLNPEAVTQLLLFTGKLDSDVAFRVEQIQGAGWVGEKIGVDPDRVAQARQGRHPRCRHSSVACADWCQRRGQGIGRP